jgi:hypothetical protein
MQSTSTNLEKRVSALEKELRKVKSALKLVPKRPQQPWWERLAGQFEDEPLFDEIVEAGRAYRRSLAPHARKC